MKNSAIHASGATENGTDISHGSNGVKSKPRKRQLKTKMKSESVSSPKTENLDEARPQSNPNGSLADQKEVTPTKMNAFQFMMNSRHKSIGRNSPGRELDLNESADSALAKQGLKVRKSRLESWSEQKGASKRKRDYEEVGKCIEYKLSKREKKLKKMLKIDCQSDDEVIVKRKRKCVVIDTDSENSSEEAIANTKKNRKIKKKAKVENGKAVFTPKSVKSWKLKIKLSMDTNGENDRVDEDDSPSEIKISENGTDTTETINKSNTSDILIVCEENSQTVTIETNVIESDDQLEKKQDENDGRRVLRTRKPKSKMFEDYVLSSDEDSDDEDKTKNKKKRVVKMAPVFLKAVPKPKLDPEVIEARRQFLMSGVPFSIKKEMERQQCVEEMDFDVFPAISHVQQLSSDNFWDLPKFDLKLTNDVSPKIEIGRFTTDLLKLETSKPIIREATVPTKLNTCKKIIHEIKSQNPDYPVYKIFNSINGRTEKSDENSKTPKRRGRPKKKSQNTSETESPAVIKPERSTHSLWTEKYKPKTSGDIIGNMKSVSSLRDWLSYWQKNTSVCKKQQDDSESEFDLTDSDSRDSSKLLTNTVILKGPPGSGKTAAVYAVCNELGYDVIEVNASSKRTGKKLLQELQEATRSHQVKKENALSSFVKEKKEEKPKHKMCALLIEDVDVVFDQDEGFAAALSQIITTSKRPVILTTTEEASPPVQKIIDDFRVIGFSPLSGILSIWLQIVCLVEGYYVDKNHLEELLNYNNGDIRRTLLQLQFFVSSGGRVKDSKVKGLTSCIKMEDDDSNMADDSNNQIHGDCLTGCLPRYIDLGKIWWNLPNILNLPNLANLRLKREEQTTCRKQLDKQKLEALFNCYDSLSFADVISGRDQYHESLERRFRIKAKDGLGLEENIASYQDDDVSRDLGYSLLDGTINNYRKKFKDDSLELKMAVPVLTEQRWRSKQLTCCDRLQGALLPGDFLERKAFCVDYMPCLRTIARSESERAARNTKRGNRFYNYLRNLGVHCGETTYKLVCDTFKIIDSSL